MIAERAILITVKFDPRYEPGGGPAWSPADEADELAELARSSGCDVVGALTAKRHQPVAGTFLGSGKLEEIGAAAADQQAQVVIFNRELSAAQQRNIEDLITVKTIDRTQLILDIFAQRARSQEGKLQVELAQLRYLLPRLTGKGILLSRLGGGIGTRGPGEQKLEVDRRRIRQRITRLDRELDRLATRRESTRKHRKETDIPVIALVGYTNAGKTTLLNRLTGAGATAKDQLFTTLDPLARRVRLASGETFVLTDTVGFLHHLPHHLIEAFRATLEEARDADIVLHVLDASHPLAAERAGAVAEVLKELQLRDKPLLTALNKRDLIDDPTRLAALEHEYRPAAAISARSGAGLDRLDDLISRHLAHLLVAPLRLRIPAAQAGLVASVYQDGQVLRRNDSDGIIELLARVPAKLHALVHPYVST